MSAWTAPASSPPNGNVSAPVNLGATTQTRTGVLNITNGLNVTAPGGYQSVGNYGGTGSAAYFPSGIWSNGANAWIYGTINTSGAIVATGVGTIWDSGGGWLRTYGATGWYSQTYGGGWYMTDTSYIRAYNGKQVRSDAGYCIGTSCITSWATGGQWSTSGSNIYYSTGNVGIGMTPGNAKLDITQNANVVGLGITSNSAGWGSGIGLNNTGGGRNWGIYSGADGSFHFNDTTAGADRLVINSSGNVAIGNAPANDKFTVGTNSNGSDGVVIRQNGDNSSSIQAFIDGQWSNRASYAGGCCNALALQPDVGSVGIGTVSPSQKLDVAGNVTAQVYYDRDNTGYYLDSNNGSVLNDVYLTSRGMWLSQTARKDGGEFWAGAQVNGVGCPGGSVVIYVFAQPQAADQNYVNVICKWIN